MGLADGKHVAESLLPSRNRASETEPSGETKAGNHRGREGVREGGRKEATGEERKRGKTCSALFFFP